MCGIVGFALADHTPPDMQLLDRMARSIEHRGPDEGGSFSEPGIALGIRRLMIIDLVTGSQPVSNEDGSVWAILNGEIYNFQELRDSLAAKGHSFRGHSDTECIVHAYEEYGDDCLRHFHGMFAIAVWDKNKERLLLGRDRVGKKPLVYAVVGDSLYFASEIQALLQVSSISRDLNMGALGEYLAYGYVPVPQTIFKGIHKLEPGRALVWHSGHIATTQYWQLNFTPKLVVTEAEAIAELRTKLEVAVRSRLVADVPLGALLSGGVDSGTVVALMAQQSSHPIKTFSIGFEDQNFDELVHARRVAERFGTDHHEFVVKPDAASILPTLARHYGEPFADSSAIPTYYVSKLARQHVTVALTGDGGDESFGGYDRYRAMVLSERLAKLPMVGRIARGVGKSMDAVPRQPRQFRRLSRFLKPIGSDSADRYVNWVGTVPGVDTGDLLSPEVAEQIRSERNHTVEVTFERYRDLAMVDRLLATDVDTYLLDDLLAKIDIASMANSLEARSPLLDHQVMEYGARLSPNLKLHGGREQKYLLKKLARALLPAENIDRPKKGFGVPVGAWLRGPLKAMTADLLFGTSSLQRHYFNPGAVQKLWAEHQNQIRDNTSALWTLLSLEVWHREVTDNPPQGA